MDLEFMEGERGLIKVSPMKRVMHFVKWGKLKFRYIGPFEVLKCVWKAAFELAFIKGCEVHTEFFMCLCLRNNMLIRTVLFYSIQYFSI